MLYLAGEYYSLSCEPTLGECQIFHSMIERKIIRTREAIKLIGDGQEQKLKKDRVIESWIKVDPRWPCHVSTLAACNYCYQRTFVFPFFLSVVFFFSFPHSETSFFLPVQSCLCFRNVRPSPFRGPQNTKERDWYFLLQF